MKKVIKYLIVCLVPLLMDFSCTKTNQGLFNVRDFKYIGCKDENQEAESGTVQLKLTSVNDNYLYLEHLNVLFNCCAKKIFATASIINNEIIFNENETNSECNCICPYDLSCKVGPLKADEYLLKIQRGGAIYAEIGISFSTALDTIVYF
jgi:hypothetical protein